MPQIQTPPQVIATASGAVVVPALAGNRIEYYSLLMFSASGEAVDVWLYNGDNDVLGSEANPITLQKTSIEGFGGFIAPPNEYGWGQTDTAGEALQIGMSNTNAVIILRNFSYLPF